MDGIAGTSAPPPPGTTPPDPEHLLRVTSGSLSRRTVLVEVVGEIDVSTAAHLRTRLSGEVRRRGPDLVVDLRRVVFLGAAGLRVLVAVATAAGQAGVRFAVVADGRTVLMPMAVTGLLDVITVHPDMGRVGVRGGVRRGHRGPGRRTRAVIGRWWPSC